MFTLVGRPRYPSTSKGIWEGCVAAEHRPPSWGRAQLQVWGEVQGEGPGELTMGLHLRAVCWLPQVFSHLMDMESRLGRKGLSLAEQSCCIIKEVLPSPGYHVDYSEPQANNNNHCHFPKSLNQVFMDTTSQLLLRSLHMQNSYPPASRQSQSFNCQMLLFFSPPFKKKILDTEPITCCMKSAASLGR